MRARRFAVGIYRQPQAGLGIRQIFGNVVHRQPPTFWLKRYTNPGRESHHN
jgi:hypothetical protein